MIENLKKLLNEEQDPKAVEKIISKLNGLLMKGEEVIYIAVQKKPAINLSPDCVALIHFIGNDCIVLGFIFHTAHTAPVAGL